MRVVSTTEMAIGNARLQQMKELPPRHSVTPTDGDRDIGVAPFRSSFLSPALHMLHVH